MYNEGYLKQVVAVIPPVIAKIILQENWIDKAANSDALGTPMEKLFDVYEEFVDKNGEHDDWNCFKCRQHALDMFRAIQPLLKEKYHATTTAQ